MIVSPTSAGAPTIAPSVNPPTEQVARDNRVREKIVPTTESAATPREKPLTSEEKQLKKPSWDPSEHPDYSELSENLEQQYGYQDDLEKLVKALSADTYLKDSQELGYSMHIKLPRDLLDELEKISTTERTKGVVAHHYAQSTIPNPPTDYLVVL
ncbi:ATP-dependent Lon protease [Photobacterium jeanii]|uniref:ATP-dependent Lon protease n=1 Tax=Photobacterium jeanii TaxID=858640 RepID=A0A178KIM2_9GAMM|nr:ATP-dependent Lon protease [Photobacterium jeanii]OAN16976.1 ATP-dependent Lon protease [Photobacterium jeanii]PST88266.1 ATP-dependent Lon protease [Photobacterium jeanii]